jgi:hypothetical protein
MFRIVDSVPVFKWNILSSTQVIELAPASGQLSFSVLIQCSQQFDLDELDEILAESISLDEDSTFCLLICVINIRFEGGMTASVA